MDTQDCLEFFKSIPAGIWLLVFASAWFTGMTVFLAANAHFNRVDYADNPEWVAASLVVWPLLAIYVSTRWVLFWLTKETNSKRSEVKHGRRET